MNKAMYVATNLFISILRRRQTGNGFSRNHEKVSGGLRIYVIEGHALTKEKKWSYAL